MTANDTCVTVAGAMATRLTAALSSYGVSVEQVADDAAIPGTYWGEPEAGIVGTRVFIRADTPVHSALHEAAHIICASPARRRQLHRDAGSSDLEEAAVCYLQIELASTIPGLGRGQMMRDMDRWGYSFRLGTTERWYREDAEDARAWLRRAQLLDASGRLVAGFRTSPD